jgi:hypothetical protein
MRSKRAAIRSGRWMSKRRKPGVSAKRSSMSRMVTATPRRARCWPSSGEHRQQAASKPPTKSASRASVGASKKVLLVLVPLVHPAARVLLQGPTFGH